MPFVERLLDLVLMRHRLKASKPYLLELMGALTLLISLVMFAMVSLSLILFVGLWLAFKLMVMLGLGNVSAGIFILVGVVVMGIGVVALIRYAQRVVSRTFEQLLGAGISLPVPSVVTKGFKVVDAFRQGLMHPSSARVRRPGDPHPSARA